MSLDQDSDADSNPYSRKRISNLMGQFRCDRETAGRITDLVCEGYTLRKASLIAGAVTCPTCGGTRVDPGGLPVCRTCNPESKT